MKRITIVTVAAALLATIAFAESATRAVAPRQSEPEREYLPSVNFMTEGFSGGAFTIPPS